MYPLLTEIIKGVQDLNQILVLDELAAVWPLYIDGEGNRSCVLTMDNVRYVIKQSPLSLMRTLMRREGMEIGIYRKTMAQHSFKKLSLPIVVRGHVFMTYKARHARIRGDETYAFLRYALVDTIQRVQNCGEIVLTSGIRLPTEETYRTAQQHVQDAAYFQNLLMKKEIQAQAYLFNKPKQLVQSPQLPQLPQPVHSAPMGCRARAMGGYLPCLCEHMLREQCPVYHTHS
jgi:hypothetical protein